MSKMNHKLPLWLTATLVVLSFFFGQALPQLWKWEESGHAKQRLKIELRDKIEDKLVKLVLLAREFKQETDGTRKKEINMQFDIVTDDVFSLERNLAELEKRPPRCIFQTLAPDVPTGIKLTPE